MDINFEGKRILVTGAGRGRQLCKVLAKSSPNVKVVALSQTQANLDSLKAEFPNVETVCADLGNWEETRKAVESVLPIDLLVNNAAIAVLQPVLETTPEAIDDCFNVNVKSMVNVSQVVAKNMKDRKIAGSIVNISSQASQAALKDHLVYCGTKGALDIMTKVMALELGPFNIRCNTVNPTVVLTDMGRLGWSDPAKAGPMLSKIPLGRFAEVDDVLGAIIFLLSDKSAMINGVTLPIDGGFLACFGQAFVKDLVEQGAIVYAISRTASKLDELKTKYPSIIPLLCDLTQWNEAEKILTENLPDDIELLVNNAGAASVETLDELTEDGVNQVLNINIKGTLLTTKIVAKKMIAGGKGGSIVNISSVGSDFPCTFLLAYSMTKAALNRLTKTLATQLGPHKIRVNSVNPTLVVDTTMGDFVFDTDEKKTMLKTITPLPNPTTEQDVSDSVLFLLSEKSKAITGQILFVDGGLHGG
ncbi:L-xylulose reductase [Orchesella cincta]|uniref:L-xylulose reductase n=1 Tax=Orchesella cincta TaxID=48709 RepID=A0A1D2MSF7_ORCCI|nr:L-xylulose reductase [Orchesella cincta]